jgi:xanthine dehydrogenase accessory factor
MVTIIGVKGSSPREAGARLLVTNEGSYRGTIGGGALEWRAIAHAQALLSRGETGPIVEAAVLGPDLGQCCGGEVKLLTEILTPADLPWIGEFSRREKASPFATILELERPGMKRSLSTEAGPPGSARLLSGNRLLEIFGEDKRPLLLFGAGHVGRALVLALAPLPFSVTWIDQRPGVFPEAFPANVTPVRAANLLQHLDAAREGSFVMVMTHSHALDFDIVAQALRIDAIPFVGLIGSETKRARFLSRLRAAGVSEVRLNSLVCPIGIPAIRSKEPAIIAASAAADLLARDERARLDSSPLPGTLRIA